MTTSSEQAPDPLGSRWRRALLWLGHQYARYGSFTSVGTMVLVLTTLLWPAGAINSGLTDATLWVVVTFVALSVVRDKFHDAVLCHHCNDETPWLDPQGEVEKHARQLSLWHHPRKANMLYGVLGAMMVAVLASAAVNSPRGNLLPVPHWVAASAIMAVSVATCVAALVLFTAGDQHRRLRPWCPDCRNGGRGPRAGITPEPRPQPVAGR